MSHTVRLTLDGHLAHDHRALEKSSACNVVVACQSIYLFVSMQAYCSAYISQKNLWPRTAGGILLMSKCIMIELCLPSYFVSAHGNRFQRIQGGPCDRRRFHGLSMHCVCAKL